VNDGASLNTFMDDIDAQWQDICAAVYLSGLATWDDWISLGRRDPAGSS
jgi:hypothetical protein